MLHRKSQFRMQVRYECKNCPFLYRRQQKSKTKTKLIKDLENVFWCVALNAKMRLCAKFCSSKSFKAYLSSTYLSRQIQIYMIYFFY